MTYLQAFAVVFLAVWGFNCSRHEDQRDLVAAVVHLLGGLLLALALYLLVRWAS